MTNRAEKGFRLLVAGGGTGGHLFPGVAVAEEFRRRDPRAEIIFVGTGRPVEAEILSQRGIKNRTITALGLKGKGAWSRVKALAVLPAGLFQSLLIVQGFKPDLVLGVGGYVSGPVVLAARLLGRPTAIQEQNSIPGATNRLLGHVVDLVFIGFEASSGFFPARKTRLTGNPIRVEIQAAAREQRDRDKPFVLLVAGGSLGARALNQAAVEAVRLLSAQGLRPGVIHQTGTEDFETVKKAYDNLGVAAEVKPFFQDMERAYREASLVLCRAGALTAAEVSAMGLPAIFVPLPWAADNHQEHNARFLAEAGAAEILRQGDLTPESLADLIRSLAQDQNRLEKMARAARRVARPDAAREICDLCEAHVKRRGKKGE
ncbi:MAG: undecaprenyldiphospho-muramoylpentapeptide beta-N-acetylglucosaminyltransferase [Pseudomonadota bacterium]